MAFYIFRSYFLKTLYLIHRWDGSPESDWYPWLKNEVDSEFITTVLPMPHPDTPHIHEWVDYLQKNIPIVDENTFFVGHSIGCQTILRFLETMPETAVAGGVVLVTPWVVLTPAGIEGVEVVAEPWLTTPINWESVKMHAQHFTAIFSDNDPFVAEENINIFKEKLGARIVIEKNRGHMTGDDGVIEVPEVVKVLKEMSTLV